jgi:amino acid adenylation domain-containing protein
MHKKSDLSARRSNLSPEKRAMLELLLRGEYADTSQTETIPRRPEGSNPLSFAQQRLWFLDQLEPNSPLYNLPHGVRLSGALDIPALERGFNALVERHEILRITFAVIDGNPVQLIGPRLTLALPVMDLEALPQEEREAEVQRLATAEARQPFDLAHGPLLRVRLLRLGIQEHVLLLTLHHIVADGWSRDIVVRELAVLYEALAAGRPAPLPELPIQYADFAHWQRRYLQREILERQLGYWRGRLAGAASVLAVPTDRPRPAQPTYRGATHAFILPAALTASLRALSRAQGATLFMTLVASFKTLLYRYSGQGDLCIGTPMANRNRLEIEGLIGFFVNTLVLRTELSDDPRFVELLGRVRETVLGAQANQDLPFERLVEKLQPVRDMSHSPLFQVMVALQNTPSRELQIDGLRFCGLGVDSGHAKFDLSLDITEVQGALDCVYEYSTDLFDGSTIERLAKHLETLLHGIVAHPEARLSELPILTEPERHRLLIEWNATAAEYPQERCLHELFEAQVEKTPEAVAVVCEGEQLSYAALNRRANRIAHYLQGLGVGAERLVGVCLERSLELVVGLLGVLKAGGAYVPLDPSYPPERLALMLEDTQAPVLLTQARLAATLPTTAAQLLCLDRDWETIAKEPQGNPPSAVTPKNLAYVIYTSGSTGKPKGVMISHRAIGNHMAWMQTSFPLTEADKVLQKTPFSFDASIWEFYAPLLTGAQLVIARPGGHQDALYLTEVLAEQQVTILQLVPSLLQMLLEAGGLEHCYSLRRLFCGGEALPLALQERFFACHGAELHNLYGPTEAAIDVTSWCCERDSRLRIAPLGRPIANTQLYLLDRHLQPVPVGVPGELYIGGVGLAWGYLERSALTAERFIPHPFSERPGERLYRTGDVARYRADGNLEFLGRVDQQVKVRGFRIELGEVEARLVEHPGVQTAVVVVREDSPGEKRLVAYVVSEAAQPAVDGLRAYLKAVLPEYMVPGVFVFLERLPLTPNGKVDRNALPVPEVVGQLQRWYVAPRTLTEELLVGIWAEVLGLERVGLHDHFFELGGHSLLATHVVSRLRSLFEVELPVRSVFESPTVAELAQAVERARVEGAGLQAPPLVRVPRAGELPLSYAQERLWFLDQLEPGSAAYNMPGALRVRGELDRVAFARAMNEIVRRHEVLRTTFAVVDGQPVQVMVPALTLSIPTVDLSALPEESREAEVRHLAIEEAQRPFDLAVGPLLRVRLLDLGGCAERGEPEQVLLFTLHHIVSDGWSEDVLVREFATLYEAFSQGQASPLPELPIQYADYAVWQRGWLQGEVLERQLAYWTGQLKGAPAVLVLPTDWPRPAVQSYRGASYEFTVSKEVTTQLHALSREAGVTLFMTLLAAFKTLLCRYTGQKDIVVGTDVANRNRTEIEGLIGFFVNQLVLRTDLSGNPTFRELLGRVREVTLGAYTHQDLPFEVLVAAMRPQRTLQYAPLFQVKLVLQNAPHSDVKLPGLTLSSVSIERTTAELDLLLSLEETPTGLSGGFEYNTDLFEATTIAALAEQLRVVLQCVVTWPDATVKALEGMLADADKQRRSIQQQERDTANLQRLKNVNRKVISAICLQGGDK